MDVVPEVWQAITREGKMSETLRRAFAKWKEAGFKAEEVRGHRIVADAYSNLPVGVTQQSEEEKELWVTEGLRHGEFFTLLETLDKVLPQLLTAIDEMRVEGNVLGPHWFGPFSEWEKGNTKESDDYRVNIEWPDLVILADDLRKALAQKG